MYKKSRSFLFLLYAVLCTMGLSSCLFQSHSKIYNLGCEYEGVSILERDTVYRIQGKEYIKGQRTRLRCIYDSWWFDPCRGVEYRPIKGKQGEIVFLQIDDNGGEYADTRGEWLTLDTTDAQQKTLKSREVWIPTHSTTQDRAIYTPWAILTVPAAVVSAVAVDIPMTVGLLMAVGVTELIPGQQQQQNSGPVNHSTEEGQ